MRAFLAAGAIVLVVGLVVFDRLADIRADVSELRSRVDMLATYAETTNASIDMLGETDANHGKSIAILRRLIPETQGPVRP